VDVAAQLVVRQLTTLTALSTGGKDTGMNEFPAVLTKDCDTRRMRRGLVRLELATW